MGKLKILFCTYHEVDCGLDNLYDGLCRVLGSENVLEYPEKPSLHGTIGRRWTWFPVFFDWSITKDDSQKLDMLKRSQFDVILFSNRIYQLMTSGYKAEIVDKYNELFEIIKEKSIPIFILDMNDGSAIEEELIDILNARLYFKRDYLKDKKYDSRIVPLSFCYSEKYIPDINTDRTTTLFWVGKSHCGRSKYIKACEGIIGYNLISAGRTEIVYNQQDYSKKILQSKIGLNLISYGYDNLRYYELPAHGVLLFSQRVPIVIEHDYTDMANAVFFDSIDEMKDKLKFLISNESFVDKARIKGYERMLNFHTTRVRAIQMLDKISKCL